MCHINSRFHALTFKCVLTSWVQTFGGASKTLAVTLTFCLHATLQSVCNMNQWWKNRKSSWQKFCTHDQNSWQVFWRLSLYLMELRSRHSQLLPPLISLWGRCSCHGRQLCDVTANMWVQDWNFSTWANEVKPPRPLCTLKSWTTRVPDNAAPCQRLHPLP